MHRRRPALTGLLVLLLGLLPLGVSTASADDRSDAESDQAAAQQKQAELTASLEGVNAELGQAYIDLQNAQTALDTAQAELDGAQTVLATKEREQQQAADRLAVAEADKATLDQEAESSAATVSENSGAVAQIVVSTYQGDNSLTTLTYVLSSTSVDDLAERASAMEIASGVQESVFTAAEEERAQDANRKSRQDALTTRVSTLKQEADDAEADAQKARDAAADKRDEVATLAADKQTAVDGYQNQKQNLESDLAQAEADEQTANQKLAEINASNPAPTGSGSAADITGASIAHPVTGPLVVTSSYGYRYHPILGYQKLHAGVDLLASCGTPQYAAVSGTVTYNQNSSCGNGMFINGGIIDGNSTVVAYCHMSSYSVSSGQTVSQGQQIGLTGMTGGATGCHVHFEVMLNGATIDPMSLSNF